MIHEWWKWDRLRPILATKTRKKNLKKCPKVTIESDHDNNLLLISGKFYVDPEYDSLGRMRSKGHLERE